MLSLLLWVRPFFEKRVLCLFVFCMCLLYKVFYWISALMYALVPLNFRNLGERGERGEEKQIFSEKNLCQRGLKLKVFVIFIIKHAVCTDVHTYTIYVITTNPNFVLPCTSVHTRWMRGRFYVCFWFHGRVKSIVGNVLKSLYFIRIIV